MIHVALDALMCRPKTTPLFSFQVAQCGGAFGVSLQEWKRMGLLSLDPLDGMKAPKGLYLAGEIMQEPHVEGDMDITAADWLALIYNKIIIPDKGIPRGNLRKSLIRFMRQHRFDYTWFGMTRTFGHIVPVGAD